MQNLSPSSTQQTTGHKTMSANVYLPDSPVVPMFLIITSITNANMATVTVSTPNAYVPGQLVRFSVPPDYGMFQINGITAPIISVDPTNLIFNVQVNTSIFDVFTLPSSGSPAPATISPAGSRNLTNFNANLTRVPFRSLNGQVGN